MEVLYEVAVDAPLESPLTYSQPAGRITSIPAGCCVRVPLGRRTVIGYVLGPTETPSESEQTFVIRPIAEVVDETPFIPQSLIPFFLWIARYYHHPIGEVLRTGVPLAPTSRNSRLLRAKTRQILKPGPELRPILAVDSQEAGTAVAARVLVRGGALTKAECKALALFVDTLLHYGGQPVPRSVLTGEHAVAGARLQRLADLGFIEMVEEQVYRDPFAEPIVVSPPPKQLTGEQQQVLASLLPAIEAAAFHPFLLFGVTGCGKTEVYLRTVKHALACGKTALILVPEIALAAQLEAHFHARFGNQLAILHSGLSDGERFDQWRLALDSSAKVVLGARSAVFAPLEHLGIVIVDEEHEPAYKQDDGLRYNGRDLAVLRAQMAGCPVVLGSATPSVVSYHHTIRGKYRLLTMTKRVAEQPLPAVEIVDLTTAKRSRPELVFSDQLISALAETLALGKQSLLFVNRRGFSPCMLCRDCGAILQCKHCQVSLTLHRGRRQLLCHYCGYTQHPDTLCPACGSSRMAGSGIGSERLEEEVRQLFPEARVARLDSDTTTNRTHYRATLKAVRARQVDVLIGTQMIAKGLHFPHIVLVGVVWADSGLGMPDYKAAERTFALMAQVTGRAGRGDDLGRVIIQTYQPYHYSIELARKHDYPGFYEREIEARQPLHYPPFSRLVNVRFSGAQEDVVAQAAGKVAALIREHPQAHLVDILGPVPSPLVKLKDRIRWQLLLKSSSSALLHEMCQAVLTNRDKLCPRSVRMHCDVDPENMM